MGIGGCGWLLGLNIGGGSLNPAMGALLSSPLSALGAAGGAGIGAGAAVVCALGPVGADLISGDGALAGCAGEGGALQTLCGGPLAGGGLNDSPPKAGT